MMYPRQLRLPNRSFFLFGPRGTGKSTWLKSTLENALYIDLLKNREYLDYSSDPEHLVKRVSHLKRGEWVVLDEVQRIPSLLSEVHSLMEERGLRFALSGSSARKLRRGGADLLAGRAVTKTMSALLSSEMGTDFDLLRALEWGTLPGVVNDFATRADILSAYVTTYLKEELLEEGLIRKVEPFTRFLRVAGILNAQVLNVENVSREASVGRTVVDTYFQILEDTLIGFRLFPFRARAKVKEVQRPKFYFFDPGVARACAGLWDETLDPASKGFFLETLILNELRGYNFYREKRKELFYYRVSGGSEIDIAVQLSPARFSQKTSLMLIEIKHAERWSSSWNKAMVELASTGAAKIERMVGVYLGRKRIQDGPVEVWPAEEFLRSLWEEKFF